MFDLVYDLVIQIHSRTVCEAHFTGSDVKLETPRTNLDNNFKLKKIQKNRNFNFSSQYNQSHSKKGVKLVTKFICQSKFYTQTKCLNLSIN